LGFFEEMGANLDNLFNGQLKDKLNAKDTFIQQAEAKFAYHDKTLFISDSLVKTNILDLTAQGSVDQALNLDLQTVLHLNEDISAVLTDEFSGLKILYDNSNRIAIDATLKGTIPHLKYKPNKDFRKKSRKALMQEGGNILGVLLGGGQGPGEGQNASSPDQGKKKNKIKNLFKSLLR